LAKSYIERTSDLREWLKLLPSDGAGLVEIYRMWEIPENYHAMVEDLESLVDSSRVQFDLVATIASTGIVFAAPIAYGHRKGLIVIRKDPKVKNELMLRKKFMNWHNEPEVLYLDALRLPSKKKVLIIDDIVQTTNSILATMDLVAESKNEPTGCVVVANLSRKDSIGGMPIRSVVDFRAGA
jgi:adenine/guanine phosphoribosyltransferase-like PRPP-binding protein